MSIKSSFVALFLLSILSINQAVALSLPEPEVLGQVSIEDGFDGQEVIDIGFINNSSDRLAFFTHNESHRFELISSYPFSSGHEAKFEFDSFGLYSCYGTAHITLAEFGNAIALAGVYPPLLKLSLSFNGVCQSYDNIYHPFSGTLNFNTPQIVDECLDYRLQNESLLNKLESLQAENAKLTGQKEALLGELRSIKKLVIKTNPLSLNSLKTLYSNLKRRLLKIN